MPNRILRDGILTSEAVAELTWAEEVFYRRLMSVVDDHGRFHALPKLIRAACYPLQIDKVSDSDIGKWTTACVAAGLVRVYPAADGKRYIQIMKFGQQVRSKSKFPEPIEGNDEQPPASDISCQQLLADAHLDVVEDVVVKTPLSADADPPPGFREFWETYPTTRKVGKAKCADIWKRKKLVAQADQILAHVKAMKASKQWQDGYDPSPLTYLNQRRWEDGIAVDAGATDNPWGSAI